MITHIGNLFPSDRYFESRHCNARPEKYVIPSYGADLRLDNIGSPDVLRSSPYAGNMNPEPQ